MWHYWAYSKFAIYREIIRPLDGHQRAGSFIKSLDVVTGGGLINALKARRCAKRASIE